jgi:hypothetical protein
MLLGAVSTERTLESADTSASRVRREVDITAFATGLGTKFEHYVFLGMVCPLATHIVTRLSGSAGIQGLWRVLWKYLNSTSRTVLLWALVAWFAVEKKSKTSDILADPSKKRVTPCVLAPVNFQCTLRCKVDWQI